MRISLITVCLNTANTLEHCIQSVLKQNYSDLEYIIIDGGSQDGTVDIIRKYEPYISCWVSEKDNGLYDAMNKGIKKASGDVIGILNADDFFATDTVLAKVAESLINSDFDGCYADLIYVNEKDINKIVRYWKSGPFDKKKMKRGWFPPHPTLYLRKKIYDRLGLFNEKIGLAADYDLMVRFLYINNVHVKYIPEVFVKMRMGGVSNRSLKNMKKSLDQFSQVWKNNGLKTPLFLAIGTIIFRAFQLLRR